MEDKMIGARFERLIVEKRVEDYVSPSNGHHIRYTCLCDCGKRVNVLKEYLKSGRQKSCGCLRKENGNPTHREIHTRLYKIWGNMCNRCSNPNNPAWSRYGQRGILVCDEWKSYENFRNWAKTNGYTDSLTIDRIDNNKGYNPDNCRWVDRYAQANNKRNNHIVEYDGYKKTLSEWASYLGIPYKTLHHRVVGLNWDIERAFTQPIRKSSVTNSTKQKDS